MHQLVNNRLRLGVFARLGISMGWRAALIVALLCTISSAEDSAIVDFRNDIIPVLTKNGCNAGACHGAAIGRGGFKLSLYGGNPMADYDAIVRATGGRRINLFTPDESLVVLKPAESVEHGGGPVIDYDSESAELLVSWIRQGAGIESTRQLSRVEVAPHSRIASLAESIPLQAIAHYSDGSTRNVSQWTIFAAEDASAVDINEASELDGGVIAKPLRRGRHIVVARYLSEVVPIEIVVPLSESEVDLASESRRNFIDDELLGTLATLGLRPSPTTDDSSFVRRVCLDLTGRLPSASRVESFIANSESDKRDVLVDVLVDELLQSDGFNQYWTLQLAKLLRIRPQRGDGTEGTVAYHHWLAEQIENEVSYKHIARELIMAIGDSHEVGPANFYRTVSGAREQAEFVSELFMGSRLRCANCHNHPLDRWTQDDYHGLAAIFAKIESGRVVAEKPNGETIHPRTLEPAVPKIPGEPNPFAHRRAADKFLPVGRALLPVHPPTGKSARPTFPGKFSFAARPNREQIDASAESQIDDAPEVGREQLVDWLTDASNPYFAKAIVNRLWRRMMGRGLVEPVDDFRNTNPATHPALLDKLAEDFASNGYRLRHTLRLIATSAAYSRTANATDQNKDDDRFYSHALRRPLEPEVLADAVSDVLQVHDKYGAEPAGTRAVALVNPKTPSRSLDILGRCGRDTSCESSLGAVGGLSQKLHLFNGELLNARIAADGSRLKRLIDAGEQPASIIDEFYLAAFARRPTDQESVHWKQQLDSGTDQHAFLEDFVWGLVTSREFATN